MNDSVTLLAVVNIALVVGLAWLSIKIIRFHLESQEKTQDLYDSIGRLSRQTSSLSTRVSAVHNLLKPASPKKSTPKKKSGKK